MIINVIILLLGHLLDKKKHSQTSRPISIYKRAYIYTNKIHFGVSKLDIKFDHHECNVFCNIHN